MRLNSEERKAIDALNALAKTWPDTLWLFSGAGSLCVMKKDAGGARVMSATGGYSESAAIATVEIENDGGDFAA